MQILIVSDLMGQGEQLEALIRRCREYSLDALCFCGNIVRGQVRYAEWQEARKAEKIPNRNRFEVVAEAVEDLRQYKQFSALVDSLGIPVLVVPGHLDAPEERYFLFMQQSAFQSDNLILLHENIYKVGAYIFTGFGGLITDQDKEDYFLLQYPRRECQFGTRRMHFLNPPRILLFHTPPVSTLDVDNGTHRGNAFVNEIIQAVSPSFLFCGHVTQSPGIEEIGSTLVVNPGALAEGRFALLNTKDRSVQLLTL
jgi:Icc-related predicted phosphoesterase